MRRNSRAGAGATGGRVRRGDKGIRSVIDVEEGPLRSFEKDFLLPARGLVEINNRVRDKWPDHVTGLAIGLVHFLERKWPRPERLQDAIVLLDLEFQLLLKPFRIDQIDDT